MTQVGPMPNGKTYSDEADGPNSLTGPTGFGYVDNLIELLGQVLVVAGNALSSAGSALSSATAAADSLTATNEAASDAQDSADAAEAALQDALDAVAAAEAFDPANYPRSDSGQTVTVLAAWTFTQEQTFSGGIDVGNGATITGGASVTGGATVDAITYGSQKPTIPTLSNGDTIAGAGAYELPDSATVSLPASPAAGDEIIIDPPDGADWASNPPTVNRNGHRLNGVEENLTDIVDQVRMKLIYKGATTGFIGGRG